MKQRGGGRIINVTTVGGKAPRGAGAAHERVARGRHQPHEVAGQRVRGRPHSREHDLHRPGKSAQIARRAKDGDVEAHYRELAKRVPIGRVADASEFADLVAFLASERAGYITGTAINFDGGMSFTV